MSLHNIVWIAFDLQPYQLQAPDWMHEPRFDITAKVPEGATRAQFHVMFQNMLVERFGLKFHRSQREVQGYELTVAKGGPKFKESGPPPPPDAPRPVIQRPTLAADGYPTVTPGISGPNTIGNRARGQWLRAGMERLIRDLNYEVGKPIVDATSLTGMYDLALFWVRDPDRPDSTGPALFGALQDQLGLKLESKKVTIPIVVVDHAEKLPTEN
jgi:uncharacterized protein (TIGR03435 family)